MNIIDILLGSILLFGLIRGFSKGLFVEVASLVALVAGIYGAIHFSNFTAEFLMQHVDWSEQTINLAAFALTFIIIVVAISLAGKALTKLADFAALGILNSILGGVFGVLKIGLILSIFLLIFSKMQRSIPFIAEEDLEESVLYEPVKSFAPMLFPNFISVEDSEESTAKSDS
ncbi:MAG: CvpA family protein [Flavobacteriaceae bacterium]|nr:CvpA family protein [Bacteroidia bacterium]MBT8288900.1 CvpA family protein [Bacteroidia bacterium]NNF74083.1 CvpA family protein [Flavobacteriaceae bacterium]NNK71792.1 CvpA family protein [Flavobacteriaceae bacterium]